MTAFDHVLFERLRVERGVTWGRPVRAFSECTSTNDLALAAIASEQKTGVVYLTERQTAGRGRNGKRWVAKAGENLLFSILLRFPESRAGLHGLSLVVGLAVGDVVKARLSSSKVVRLKWPNDVYVGDRKIAGVLIESRKDTAGHTGVVIGVGLNKDTYSFPDDLPNPTSLVLEGAAPECMESLLVDLLSALQRRIQAFLTGGLAAWILEIQSLDYLRARSILIDGVQTQAMGIDDQGRLLVVDAAGRLSSIVSGTVELPR